MGKRGFPPAPTPLKIVRGTRKDRVNSDEPLPDGAMARPTWLRPAALAVWDHYAPKLGSKRVATDWDEDAFLTYCDAVARRNEAIVHVTDEGAVVQAPVFNRNGEVTGFRLLRNEWLMVLKDSNEIIGRFGARFGLTPSDRSQLKVGDGGQANASERLLG